MELIWGAVLGSGWANCGVGLPGAVLDGVGDGGWW